MNAHPNGAEELTGMTLHADDVDDAAYRFGLLGRPQAPEILEIKPAKDGLNGFTALHLRTRSLDQTAQTLHKSGQPLDQYEGKLFVQAPGVRLVFCE